MIISYFCGDVLKCNQKVYDYLRHRFRFVHKFERIYKPFENYEVLAGACLELKKAETRK